MERPVDILRRRGLRPKKSWGQNFLEDPHVLAQIVEAAQVGKGAVVIELGAGLGHLTAALCAQGARVIAVERDRDMVEALGALELDNLQVVAANALEVEFDKLAQSPSVTVVGNLPYHLTSPLLFRVLDQRAAVPRAVFTLQREVVTRLAAAPGSRDYGLLSVLLGLFFDVEKILDVPAHLFHPPPQVDSAVVRLTRLPAPRAPIRAEERYRKLVKAAFAQRRKTLLNSLRSDRSLGEGDVLRAALAQAGVDPNRRAETLSPEEFAAIERALP